MTEISESEDKMRTSILTAEGIDELFPARVRAFNVSVKTNYDSIRIYINDCLSVFLKRSELLGFYGLVNGGGKWQIEFSFVGGCLICEYDSQEKFFAIMNELDKNIKL